MTMYAVDGRTGEMVSGEECIERYERYAADAARPRASFKRWLYESLHPSVRLPGPHSWLARADMIRDEMAEPDA